MAQVLLCIDKECIRYPAMIGLPDESLERQEWLQCVSSAEEVRRSAREGLFEQVWILSCTDMLPINVAAAIKHDNPRCFVSIISNEQDGSFSSRASCAHVDYIWDKQQFIKAYETHKSACIYETSAVKPSVSVPYDTKQSTTQKSPFTFGMYDDPKDATVITGSYNAATGEMTGVTVPNGYADNRKRTNLDAARTQVGASLVVSVVAASGGVGKSTVSSMLAVLAQSCGLRTLLMDADLQFGDVHDLVGQRQPIRIDEVIENQALLQQLVPQQDMPALLAAPVRAEVSEVVAPHIGEIIEVVRNSFDVVVCNTGSFWGDVQAQLLEASDKTLFLIDQRPSSLRSCIHALELCSRMGIATHPFHYAINCFSKTGLISSVDASCALRGAHVDEIAFGGQEVDDIVGAGYPLELLHTKNPFLISMRSIVLNLLGDVYGAQLESLTPPRSFGFLKKRGK